MDSREVRHVTNMIVAFSKAEDGRSIQNILVRNGYQVAAVCTSGAQAAAAADGLNGGIVVCGWRFEDMMYQELKSCLPPSFSMLLIASPSRLAEKPEEGVIYLSMPLKVCDLLGTVEMMVQAQTRLRRKQKSRPKERSPQEQELIDQAKALLMERNGMTEAEAHRYIQKCSMDSGTNLVETAQMVISLIHV